MDSGPLRVAVAGGGIGGMASALLLARGGARVTLVEQAPEPRPVGAAVALFPNGLSVLYGLGLRDRLLERAHLTRSGGLMFGSRLVNGTIPDFGDGLDHVLALTRTHLLDVLHEAVRAEGRIETRFGREVVGASPDGRLDIVPSGEPGPHPAAESLRADLVVGADGIGSAVRDAGDFGARRSRTPGLTLRALVEGEPFPQDIGEFWSEHGIAIGVPVGTGQSYLALSASRGRARDAIQRRDLAELREVAESMLPGGGEALAGIGTPDELIFTPIERVGCQRWVDGRLVLLGDAAHAMAPHLGQGANSALLDAFILARELARGEAPGCAAAAYEAHRRRTCTWLQRGSEMYRLASETATMPGVRHARNAVLSLSAGLSGRYLRVVQQEDPAGVQAAVRALR